jgi:hypothetical protein
MSAWSILFCHDQGIMKWEYLVVVRENAGFYGGTLASLGDKGIKTKISPDLAVSLNSLGNEGWELISHFESEFVFKRPKSSPPGNGN